MQGRPVYNHDHPSLLVTAHGSGPVGRLLRLGTRDRDELLRSPSANVVKACPRPKCHGHRHCTQTGKALQGAGEMAHQEALFPLWSASLQDWCQVSKPSIQRVLRTPGHDKGKRHSGTYYGRRQSRSKLNGVCHRCSQGV